MIPHSSHTATILINLRLSYASVMVKYLSTDSMNHQHVHSSIILYGDLENTAEHIQADLLAIHA